MMGSFYVDVLPTDAQIPDRSKAIMLVIVDGEDGLIMSEVESLFSLSQFDVRRVLADACLPHRKLSGAALRVLCEEGLISSKVRQVTFIPRDSLRILLGIIGDDEQRRLFQTIWPEPQKPLPERAIPRRSFRRSVVRSLRKLFDERRLVRREIDDLRRIVEKNLRPDSHSMATAVAKVSDEPDQSDC